MSMPVKNVISASRRTDIPAFYMDWFMRQISLGFFSIPHPYTGKPYKVQAAPETVHTIVFWSKNMRPFIDGGYGGRLTDRGYSFFFNFTINSEDNILEPHIPPLSDRLLQAESLCRAFGPERMRWRFDPICFFKDPKGGIVDNMHDLVRIADQMAKLGVTECITSFVDQYAKVRRRPKPYPAFAYVELEVEDKVKTLLEMERILEERGILLLTCCEKEVQDHLPETSTIKPSSCIPNDRLQTLGDGSLSLRRDTGQRVQHGCNCMLSKDIGSYKLHPCYHNCHFCYANPVSDTLNPKKQMRSEPCV